MPWSVIRSDGPLGEPVEAVRVTPPQPKLSDGTLTVLDDVPDDVVVPPDEVVPDEVAVPPVDVVVVPPDEVVVPPDTAGVSVGGVVVPVDEAAPVDVLPVDVVPAEAPSPPHPIKIKEEAAAAASMRVERVVMALAAWFRSWRIPCEAYADLNLLEERLRPNDRCG